jgi:hypothetical protein
MFPTCKCRYGSVGGAAWLSWLVRRGSVGLVRRGSVGWCGMAQLVARRLAVRQARVRFSAWHHREGFFFFPTELSKRWGDGERPRRMATDKWIVWMLLNVIELVSVLYVIKTKNKQKEWHCATKPLKCRYEAIRVWSYTTFISCRSQSWDKPVVET